MNEMESRIREMNLREAYTFLISDGSLEGANYNKMRFGLQLKVDIYDYFNNNFIIKPKKQLVLYGGRMFPLSALYSEFESREKMAKELLIAKYGAMELVKCRE